MRTRWFGAVVALLLMASAAAAPPEPCPSRIPFGDNPRAGDAALVNGVRIDSELYGSGPPLLLIHGNGGSIRGWRCQIQRFSRWYRVIATDVRHHVDVVPLVTGGDDDAIRLEHFPEIFRALPHAQLAILPGATHVVFYEQPEAYNAVVERFLRQPFMRPTTKESFGIQ